MTKVGLTHSSSTMDETIAAPGLATTEVNRPPPAVEHESKRVPVFDEVEDGMVGRMTTLRHQTVAKNKEFVRQLDALTARRLKLKGRIAEEVVARDEQFAKVKAATEVDLAALKKEFSAVAAATTEALQREYLDVTAVRLDKDVETEEEFYKRTVPAVNEKQTGQLVRQMLRSRESFDIDNANLRAREAVLIRRFEDHCAATEERFSGEAHDRYTSQCKLREALGRWMSTSEREEAASQVRVLKDLFGAKGMLAAESEKRETADMVVLNNLQKAMANAQAIVLENFGSV